MTTELVSIIIPCYNNGPFVAEAIESALSQTYPNIEVIVIDDGSSDNSAAVIAGFGDQIIHLSQANAGACVARNNGLARARGEFIKFLDADDILGSDCIERQVAFASGRDIVVFGDCVLLHESGRIEYSPTHAERSALKEGDQACLATFLNQPVYTPSTLYRRRSLLNVGGFNPELRRGQEHDLHLRLYANGINFEYHSHITFAYRQHNSLDRISVSRKHECIMNPAQFERIVNEFKSSARKKDWHSNKLLLGRFAWKLGRTSLRNRDQKSAMCFFEIAERLGGQDAVQGSKIYCNLVRAIGPLIAERISHATYKYRRKGRNCSS